jgi:hypothetical protein
MMWLMPLSSGPSASNAPSPSVSAQTVSPAEASSKIVFANSPEPAFTMTLS